MATSSTLPFLLGTLTGVGLSWVCYVFWPSLKRLFYQVYQGFSDPHDLGFPFHNEHLIILVRNGYCLAFDKKLYAARWAVHKMNRLSITARLVERRPPFLTDKELPQNLRVSPKHYDDVKPWQRGHLVPCEDINYSARSNRQTFLMSNVLPQHEKLNCNAWRSLEHHIRLWTEILGVCTGFLRVWIDHRVSGLTVGCLG